VLITAEDRPILAVDNQGSTYARYVALLPGVLYSLPPAVEDPGPLPPELAKWSETTPAMRQVLCNFANRHLGLPTLESRHGDRLHGDRLDFAEVSVWSVRDALLYAYTLGVCDGASAAGRRTRVSQSQHTKFARRRWCRVGELDGREHELLPLRKHPGRA
jgi:hypothetical protein